MLKSLLTLSLISLICGASTLSSPRTTRTPLPTLTPTPLFNRWQAADVVQAIKAAGLENESTHFMTPEEYGPLPALAVQGIRFSIPSVCPDCGGMVLSFNDSVAFETTRTYYTRMSAQADPDLSSWVFEKDNILLQLSGQLPESQALQYGAVLTHLQ